MSEPKTWHLDNGVVAIGVFEIGGQIGPARFRFGEEQFEPLHEAPWVNEAGAADIPMLQHLRGDFFCAPFGANDLLVEEGRDHGLTANGRWRELEHGSERLLLELAGRVAGAKVLKEVRLEPGQPVVYQRHTFEGGAGELPMGHHTMLRVPPGEQLLLSFSPFSWAGTPPHPVESDPERGRSLLEYPQEFESLERVALAAGGTVDLSRYPTLEGSEEILLLASDPRLEFAWSAAVAPESGWLWFALRPNRVLRSTLLWLSNAGRYYPPFSGRHSRVLGVEEVTSFFHHGHVASTGPNRLERLGVPTSVRLSAGSATIIDYAFGVVPLPPGFAKVASLEREDAHLLLADGLGRELRVPFSARWP
ncbi:MAG TPA: hypothetical protein VF168_05990 [Trueperaceae bacterium]